MGNNVANEDMKVNFTSTTGQTYTTDQGIDTVKIVPTISTKCSACGKKICTEKITLTFSVAMACPHSFAAHTFVSGSGTITATATKCKAEGKLVLRVDDAGNCVGSWTNNSTGATVPCACTLKIADAGQTKVKGE
jgi:flagellar hook protein FlgE